MVGDSLRNDVVGAQRAGLTALLLDRAGRMARRAGEFTTVRGLGALPV